MTDVARRHGTTRWQVYDWRKKLRDGRLVEPEIVAALPMFAELVVEGATAKVPAGTAVNTNVEIVVNDVVIRVGPDTDGSADAGDPGGAGGSIVMFGQGGPVKVYFATRPVDFRNGIDGLALAVQEMFGLDPFCGAVFVFRSKRADRIKLLVWDQTGMVLVHKRLEGGKFVWPQVRDGVIRVMWMISADKVALDESLRAIAQNFTARDSSSQVTSVSLSEILSGSRGVSLGRPEINGSSAG